MLVDKEHRNSACAGQGLWQEEKLNKWFKRGALITRNIWGFCPLIAEHTLQNPATTSGCNVTLKISPLPFKLGSNLSSRALKYCRWSSQGCLLFCKNHSSAWPCVPPPCSWVLYPEPSHPTQQPAPFGAATLSPAVILQEIVLLGLFWIDMSARFGSLYSEQTVPLPSHHSHPWDISCVLCQQGWDTTSEVKKHMHKIIFWSSGSPRARANLGEVWCIPLVANCLSGALAMEISDGKQLLQTAWWSGWELEMQKATPRGFHPLSLCGAAHSAVQTADRAIKDHSFPPKALRSTKKGLRVLSQAKFSHPISPDGMNFTSQLTLLLAELTNSFFPSWTVFPHRNANSAKYNFLLTFVMGNYWNTSFPV